MPSGIETTCIEEIWKEFPSMTQYEVRSALAKCGLTTKPFFMRSPIRRKCAVRQRRASKKVLPRPMTANLYNTGSPNHFVKEHSGTAPPSLRKSGAGRLSPHRTGKFYQLHLIQLFLAGHCHIAGGNPRLVAGYKIL